MAAKSPTFASAQRWGTLKVEIEGRATRLVKIRNIIVSGIEMSAPHNVRLPGIPLFSLDPSHTGGRHARSGFEFQDEYTASALAGFWTERDNFIAARVEAVEDLETLVRTGDGWLETYYQIKTRQEGGSRWTVLALEKENTWARLFSLYRQFLTQKFEINRKVEFVIALEGDLDPELLELREKGTAAFDARAKLLSILKSALEKENPSLGIAGAEDIVDLNLDGFIPTLRFESRLASLQNLAFAKLIQSGDLSPEEGHQALSRLLDSIRRESLEPNATVITLEILKGWLGIRERAILQRKPIPGPLEILRRELIDSLAVTLKGTDSLLVHGISKVGKSHLISALIDHLDKAQDYFWFTFSGDDGDKDKLLFQLAQWLGQRTSVWQIKEDIERGHLLPTDALRRLARIPAGDVYLILDDCQKCSDRAFLEQIWMLTSAGWTEAKILFIGEEKIPELLSLGVRDTPVGGLEPKEGILLLSRLGIDVRDATAELALLCVQVDGHPALLNAIATELPARPSPAQVMGLSQTLPSASAVQPFLQVLSDKLISSLKTEAQHAWLGRLANLTSPFGHSVAIEIAELEPKIAVSPADWNYLVSHILDETGASQFIVPTLLRPLAIKQGQEPSARAILVISARHVFRTASVSNRIDFWDFHGAIFNLILAERYDEAAIYFLRSLAASMRLGSFSLFKVLFMVLNSELVLTNLKDNFSRFSLLFSEFQMRVQFEVHSDYPRLIDLLRRMRTVPKAGLTDKAVTYARITVHSGVALVRVNQLKDSSVFAPREGRRAFAPIHTALGIAVQDNDPDFIHLILGMYLSLHSLTRTPDVEILKQALFKIPKGRGTPSGNGLASIYVHLVASKGYDDAALELCERHSREYRQAGRGDAYFACEHAVATILHHRFCDYKKSRNRTRAALVVARALGASEDAQGTADLLLADSYWSERNYVRSAEYYTKALPADFDNENLSQWVRERLADSLIFLQHFGEAERHLIGALRRFHATLSSEHKATLYARLAYACAESGSLKKASIACLGLCRLARTSGIVEIDRLSALMGDWVLQHFKYSDPAIPQGSAQIRDSSALSEKPTDEQMDAWRRTSRPFATGLTLAGTLFELLGEFRRSEFLYSKAIEASKGADMDAQERQGREHILLLRTARVQIRRKKLTSAAETFRTAVEGLTILSQERGKESPSPGAAAYAIAVLTEPSLDSCSDPEVLEFFAQVNKQFAGHTDMQAWLLLKESEVLFNRLMVQRAKLVLAEAEGLARSSDEPHLLWAILYAKLFVRTHQIYRDPADWLRDALELGLAVAKDERLAPKREEFGNAAFKVAGQLESALGPVDATNSGLGRRWKTDPFPFAMLAMWKVARLNHLTIASMSDVENFLRNSQALDAADLE